MRWNVLLFPTIPTNFANRAIVGRMFRIRMECQIDRFPYFGCGESPQGEMTISFQLRIMYASCRWNAYWITQRRENWNEYNVYILYIEVIQVIQSIIFLNESGTFFWQKLIAFHSNRKCNEKISKTIDFFFKHNSLFMLHELNIEHQSNMVLISSSLPRILIIHSSPP